MAVYERTYKRYTGEVTATATRLLIIPRYAFKDVFKSKLFTGFFALCFVFPLFGTGWIYLANNLDFLAAFPGAEDGMKEFLKIDGDFFQVFMNIQAWLAFVIALIVGPGLISKDLANNGLPLYLCRPFSRTEYVLGKLTVLGILLSAVTWGCGLWLFLIQTNFEGLGWAWTNLHLAAGVLVGSGAWILTISLLALAVSAWVRWRPVAAFMMLMLVLVGMFFGGFASALFRTEWPFVFNLGFALNSIWVGLFDLPPTDPPLLGSWAVLAALAVGSLFLLHRKIRAYEVVS